MSQKPLSTLQGFKGSYEIEQVNGQLILTLRYGWLTVASVLPSAFATMTDKQKDWQIKAETRTLRKRLEWRIKQERTKLRMAG